MCQNGLAEDKNALLIGDTKTTKLITSRNEISLRWNKDGTRESGGN